MRDQHSILRRVLLVAGVVLVVAVAGCSSVGPTDTWSAETGKVTGTVRSDTQALLPSIEVWMWAELPDIAAGMAHRWASGGS